MRQGQQHRRGRTRGGQNNNHGNNNNRKGQNPLSRSYQSNGPDGKVSGTASSIAEKYLSLARDAASSGDPVLAENYLQHAEHYNRIILAYRESQAQPADDGQARHRHQGQDAGEGGEDGAEDEGESFGGRDMQPLPPMEARERQGGGEQHARGEGGNRQEGNPQRFDDRQRFNDYRRNNQQRERYQPERFNNGDRNNERHSGGDRFNQQRDRFQNGQPYQGERQQRDRDHGYDRDRQGGERGFQGGQSRGERGDRGERGERFERREYRGEGAHQPPRPDIRVPETRGGDAQPDYRSAELRADVQREVVKPEAGYGEASRAEVSHADPVPPVRAEGAPRPAPRPRRERAPVGEHEQPEFLRRPVRRPRREVSADEGAPAPAATSPQPDREPGQD